MNGANSGETEVVWEKMSYLDNNTRQTGESKQAHD